MHPPQDSPKTFFLESSYPKLQSLKVPQKYSMDINLVLAIFKMAVAKNGFFPYNENNSLYCHLKDQYCLHFMVDNGFQYAESIKTKIEYL